MMGPQSGFEWEAAGPMLHVCYLNGVRVGSVKCIDGKEPEWVATPTLGGIRSYRDPMTLPTLDMAKGTVEAVVRIRVAKLAIGVGIQTQREVAAS